MYIKFHVGFRVINVREPLQNCNIRVLLWVFVRACTTCACEHLPGTTQMITPLAKSTPITQSSQMPAMSDTLPPIRDILEPTSNE